MKTFYSLLIAIFLCHACETPYDFDINTEKYLVAEGLITDQEGMSKLKLSWSSDFKGAPENGVVSGAVVASYDESGDKYSFKEVGQSGIYRPGVEFKPEVGKSYYMEFIVDGLKYRSLAEELRPALSFELTSRKEYQPEINRIGDLVQQKGFGFYAHPNPGDLSGNFYLKWSWHGRYELNGTGHFDQPSSDEVKITNLFANSTAGDIELKIGFRRDSFTEHVLYHLTARQYALSWQAFKYWSMIELQVRNTGGFFDSYPTTIDGNIVPVGHTQKALGYIMIAGTRTEQINVLFD